MDTEKNFPERGTTSSEQQLFARTAGVRENHELRDSLSRAEREIELQTHKKKTFRYLFITTAFTLISLVAAVITIVTFVPSAVDWVVEQFQDAPFHTTKVGVGSADVLATFETILRRDESNPLLRTENGSETSVGCLVQIPVGTDQYDAKGAPVAVIYEFVVADITREGSSLHMFVHPEIETVLGLNSGYASLPARVVC